MKGRYLVASYAPDGCDYFATDSAGTAYSWALMGFLVIDRTNNRTIQSVWA